MTDIMRFWPIAVVAAGAIASGSVDTYRLSAHAENILDLSESVDENEDSIETIQRQLIQRQGETALQVQRIETEQKNQGKDLNKILLLLEQINRTGN